MTPQWRARRHRLSLPLAAAATAATVVGVFVAPIVVSGPSAAAAPSASIVPAAAGTGANCSASASGDVLSRAGWAASTNAPSSSGDAPAHALDGNLSTRFSTDKFQQAGLFLQVDLGIAQTFDELAMAVPSSPTDYARGFMVESSNDAKSWSVVADCHGTGDSQVVSFPAQTARYLRVVLNTGINYWWSIDELNLYGPVNCAAPVSGSALYRGHWVATSNAPSGKADVPANALDDNLATRFSTDTDQKPGFYLQADMGTVQEFDEVALLSPGSPTDYARGFEVQVSGDGRSWSTVATCTGTSDIAVVSFPPQAATFVRVILTASASDWWSVDELYLYTNHTVPTTTTTTTTTTTVPVPTTQLYSSADPVTVGSPVTYTAKLSPVPSGGSVTFMGNGTPISGCAGTPVGTSNGEASCTTTYYSGGRFTVQAFYSGVPSTSGSRAFQPSVSGVYAEVVDLPPAGYLLATANGQVFASGAALATGGMSTTASTGPVVGIASTPSAKGYWLVSADGTVATFGDATFYGDLPDLGKSVRDIVAIAPTSDGKGYYLVGADGGFFTFGDATFHGSLPGLRIHVHDIVGMVGSPGGAGYLLVGADGGVFTFGHSRFYGSLPGIRRHVRDIRAILPSSSGTGYVLVGADGGAFVFGTGVQFHGSLPGEGIRVGNVVGIALTPDNGGYYMAGSDGRVYGFGDAQAGPMPAGLSSNLPVAAIAGT